MNLGQPQVLLRYLLAVMLDRSGAARQDVTAAWAELTERTPATATTMLSRHLAPNGPPISPRLADELAEAIERCTGTQDVAASRSRFHAFHDRLLASELPRQRQAADLTDFVELTEPAARNPAELFHQAEMLVEAVRHAPSHRGWAILPAAHEQVARRITTQLLSIAVGGGHRAQHAAALLADLAREERCWHLLTQATHHDPLGGRLVTVYTRLLTWEAQAGEIPDGRSTERPLTRAIIDQLRARCTELPANERLRAARGLTVEALAQCNLSWPPDDRRWVASALEDRARGTVGLGSSLHLRSARERAFAWLVLGKRFGPERSQQLVEIAEQLQHDALLDPVARWSVRRHLDLLQGERFTSSPPGTERARFYEYAPDYCSPWAQAEAAGADELVPGFGVAYRSIRSVIDRAIEAAEAQRRSFRLPHSIKNGFRCLIDAALWDIDAVGRRIAIDLLAASDLALLAAHVLAAVLDAEETRHRSWPRCTALSAIGQLQEVDDDLLQRIAHHAIATTASEPPEALGPGHDPSAVQRSALLCLGDLFTEIDERHTPMLTTITNDLGHAARALETDDEILACAFAYALGSARSRYPRPHQLLDYLHRLGSLTRPTPYLSGTIDVMVTEVVGILVQRPALAIDPSLIYRSTELVAAASEASDGAAGPIDFLELVRQVARAEELGYTRSPALYACMIAGNELGLRHALSATQRVPGGALRVGLAAPTHAEVAAFRELHQAGVELLVPFYEQVISELGRRPVVPVRTIARILAMLSEGASSQGGADPTVHELISLSDDEVRALGLPASSDGWTIFSLAATVLADRFTVEAS